MDITGPKAEESTRYHSWCSKRSNTVVSLVKCYFNLRSRSAETEDLQIASEKASCRSNAGVIAGSAHHQCAKAGCRRLITEAVKITWETHKHKSQPGDDPEGSIEHTNACHPNTSRERLTSRSLQSHLRNVKQAYIAEHQEKQGLI